MHAMSPVVYSGDTESIPQFESLPDSPADEQLYFNELRAAIGATAPAESAAEEEVNQACAMLADALPGQNISIGVADNHHLIDGRWLRSTRWIAMLLDADLTAFDDASPVAAAEKLITAHRKANAPIRVTPEHRPLTAASFEAFGTINPATAADFLDLVDQHHGRNDFLVIQPDGRVMLATGEIEGSEAATIGSYVAIHNLTLQSKADEMDTRIIVEPHGASFKSILILPNGRRLEVTGVCPTEALAREWAKTALLQRRSTLAPAVAASSELDAA
jgi:hypothetical protein